MKVVCPNCKTGYTIPEERITQFGRHVVFPCPSCKGKIEINLDETTAPAPGVSVADQTKRTTTGEELRKAIISSINDLPPMPQVARHTRQVIADKNCTFSQVARVIEADQAIATKVLKLANSAYYGVMGTVTSVQQAAMILGIKTLNQLLEIACSAGVLSKRLQGYGQETGDLWRHSLAVAGCARAIAKRRNINIMDDAFSAGLIHDCGKLILDRYLSERAAAFNLQLKDWTKKIYEAERAVFGFDHAQIAAGVCEKWDIPKRLVSAIQHHHAPSVVRNNELAYIVHAANAIMHAPDIATIADTTDLDIDPEVLKFLGIDLRQIAFFWREANDYMEKTTSSM